MNVSYHSVGMTLQSSKELYSGLVLGLMHGTAVPPADHTEYSTCCRLLLESPTGLGGKQIYSIKWGIHSFTHHGRTHGKREKHSMHKSERLYGFLAAV